jgi:hypothetical protein
MNAAIIKNPAQQRWVLNKTRRWRALFIIFLMGAISTASGTALERVKYNNPSLIVVLGVGLWAWPLPMDYDSDGDYDIVVSCPDKPYNGTYFFENSSGNIKMPVFKPAVRVGIGHKNIRPSYIDGKVRLLLPGREVVDFRELREQFKKTRTIYPSANVHSSKERVRANQYKERIRDQHTKTWQQNEGLSAWIFPLALPRKYGLSQGRRSEVEC